MNNHDRQERQEEAESLRVLREENPLRALRENQPLVCLGSFQEFLGKNANTVLRNNICGSL